MDAAPEVIVFGPFRLDLANHRLVRDSQQLELRRQVLRVLGVLLQNAGRDVTYQDICREAWDGNWASRHTVAVTINELKKALQGYGSWITCRPKLGYRLDLPESNDRLQIAWYCWQRRTQEGLEKRRRIFRELARENPSDVRALGGLAKSCLMLGIYGMRRPREMYREFLDAHQRMVALMGLTPELRADRAYGLHLFERKLREAEAELLQARKEEPGMVAVHIRLAILYISLGRFDDALTAVARAQTLDPLGPALLTELVINICRRRFESAARCGRKLVDLHPYLSLGRMHYALALEYCGKGGEAVEEHRRACLTSPEMPVLRAAEGACYARLGRRQKARHVLEELQEVRRTAYVDGYYLALLLAALGRKNEAFEELERARQQNSPVFFLLEVDPRLDALRPDPRFARLRESLFGASVSPRNVA